MSRLGRIGPIVLLLLACRDPGDLIEPTESGSLPVPQLSVVVFDLTDLGSPLGGAHASALAVNDLGEVVGISAPAVGGLTDLHAFHWINGAVRDLAPASDRTIATDVNATSQIVGSNSPLLDFPQALFWGTGPAELLALLPTAFPEQLLGQSAEAINDRGEIVGSATVQTLSATVTRGVHWASKDAAESEALEDLGGSIARPQDINSLGQIVGTSRDESGADRPVFWASKDAAPEVLLPFPAFPDAIGIAHAINELGQVVGQLSLPFGPVHAVIWPDKDATPIDLGTSGGEVSQALDINDLGQIVGYASPFSSNLAVLWLPQPTNPVSYQMHYLNEVAGLFAASSLANSVNNTGQAVGTVPTGGGDARAVLWSIPILAPIQVTPSPIKLDGKGYVRVAILTNPWFNASNVDPSSLTLGNDDGLDTPIARKKKLTPMATLADVDRDGDVDLIAEFDKKQLMNNGDLVITGPATSSLTLLGRLRNGKHVRGAAVAAVQKI